MVDEHEVLLFPERVKVLCFDLPVQIRLSTCRLHTAFGRICHHGDVPVQGVVNDCDLRHGDR